MKNEFQKPSMKRVMKLYPGREPSTKRLERDKFARVLFSVLAKGELGYIQDAIDVKDYKVKKG